MVVLILLTLCVFAMPKNRRVTIKQIEDARDILQRVLETETFTLTTLERLEILGAKRSLKMLTEMRKEGK